MAEGYQQRNRGTLEPGNADTDLDSVMRFYRVTAQAEGKSPETIAIMATAVSCLRRFLEGKGYSTDVTKIGILELREFILHLQQVRAFENHPDTHPQARGLAGHTIHAYLRSLRAFWNWCVREEFIERSPFTKLRAKVTPTRTPKSGGGKKGEELTPSPTPAEGAGKTNVGVIVGPIVAVIIIVLVAYLFLSRRKKK